MNKTPQQILETKLASNSGGKGKIFRQWMKTMAHHAAHDRVILASAEDTSKEDFRAE